MTPDRHPALIAAPEHLLQRRNAPRLVKWLEARGTHRPLLVHLLNERRHRGIKLKGTP